MLDKNNIPKHIAIIMDGNGRWAKKQGLPRIRGHRAGIERVKEIVKACIGLNIRILTLYAFSVENWKRPRIEINMLMRLLEEFLRKETDNLIKNDIRLRIIGRINELPERISQKLKEIELTTQDNKTLMLNLALNYGGRFEIVDAVKTIIDEVLKNKLKPEEIDEGVFEGYLYTSGIPDPDLLIRTSGEIRISNFLLWQISYSEIYITKKYWPDFKKRDLEKAIYEYQKRERRFGGIR
ncbi:MAG: isoprenyl transferase [Candidatus Omnitrophica bacterium]|nr:isoprenyl transferase [Candidatus Omnitrophota bacterium]